VAESNDQYTYRMSKLAGKQEKRTPLARPIVKQADLRHIVETRAHLAETRARVKYWEDVLAKSEALTIFAIDRGDPCEPGALTAGITIVEGARRPAWKEEFARACGADAVERVIAATVAPERRTLTILESSR